MDSQNNLRFKILECEGLQVAATVEAETTDEHPIYHPANMLYYMIQGQFNLKLDNQLHVIEEGGFCLVRKYTHGKCFKTWSKEQDGARTLAFALQDDFLRNILEDKHKEESTNTTKEISKIVFLPQTPLLQGLVNSLSAYFGGGSELDKQLVQLKTAEALMALIDAKPDITQIFKEFSIPERANIVDFMNHNFMYNFSLDKFASMSGRSLSTFHRDFKTVFNESPHKWIIKKRLQMAMQMIQLGKRASDVYLDVGFEDLAHFSKRFKSFFGQNPSEVKQFAT